MLIYNDGSPVIHLSAAASREILSASPPGSIVDVEVLGNSRGGGQLIRFSGKNWNAVLSASLPAGSVFQARVTLRNGIVHLMPLHDAAQSIPPSEMLSPGAVTEAQLSLFLGELLTLARLSLPPARMRQVLSLAPRFPGKERQSLEAAVLLFHAGILPDEPGIRRCLALMEGNEDDQSLQGLLNRKKGLSAQWIIVPFKRKSGETVWSGSIRFLFDYKNNSLLTTRISACFGADSIEIELKDGNCHVWGKLLSPSTLSTIVSGLVQEMVDTAYPHIIDVSAAYTRIDLEA